MIGRVVLALALALPVAAMAQEIRDTPRALEGFADVTGYADLPDAYGTPASPDPSELGLILVSRMFRNVCLGIENGAALPTVLPEGFSVHTSAFWLMGDASPRDGGALVLSSTGDIALDEDNGHPAIELRPDPGGMTCRISWRIPGEVNDLSLSAIADLVSVWIPWEYALIDASRPEPFSDPTLSRVIEWDRPCGKSWCPMTALYSLDIGDVSLTTTLNITDIQGDAP